jgi:Holliday junction resolvase-like predicted endonuclease
MEDPVIIKKSISPSKKSRYTSGEKATVFVEVKRRRRTPQQAVGHARRRRRLIEIDEL